MFYGILKYQTVYSNIKKVLLIAYFLVRLNSHSRLKSFKARKSTRKRAGDPVFVMQVWYLLFVQY